MHLSLALGGFWHVRGHMSEGSGWLVDALTQTSASTASEPPTAADRTLRARALGLLGLFGQLRGDLYTTQAHLEESLALFRELEDSAGIADVLGDYGMLFVLREDYEQAEAALNESLALWRKLGYSGAIAGAFLFLGNLAYARGNVLQAGTLWEESLDLFRAQINNTWNVSTLLTQRAMIALEEGNYRRASESLVESPTLLRELGEVWQTAHTLEVFACLAAAQRQQADGGQSSLIRSARIFGAAEMLRETITAPALTVLRRFNERSIVSLRAQLDEGAFKAAWAEGKAMTLDQVVAYALSQGL
jgi:serine/threonine-protein kinase PknK